MKNGSVQDLFFKGVRIVPGVLIVWWPVWAATRWVSPSGSDTPGAGTERSPYATMGYAVSQALAGDTICLTSGTFHETRQTVLKNNMVIIGNGRTGPGRSIVYAPSSWNFTADKWRENTAGYIIRAENVVNCKVGGMEMRGNNCTANGALYCAGSTNVVVYDVGIYDFRYYGVRFVSSSRVSLYNSSIENSGFEWGKDPATPFPDGGSLGSFGASHVRDGVFHDITIKTTSKHGYGMKLSSLDRCTFYNLSFDMYPYQSWMCDTNALCPGNFDIEIHGGHARLVEFHHCRFTATLSIMGGSGALYDTVDYSVHLHHNLFDLGGDYGIELGTDKMVVDHNYFRDTWACMQNFGRRTTRISGLTFCHNICENIGMRVIGSAGLLENVRYYNNTVVMADDGWQSYQFTQEYENGSTNWYLVNNAIIGDRNSTENNVILSLAYGGQSHVRQVYASSNCYTRATMAVRGDSGVLPGAVWEHVFTGNIAQDPGLPLTGMRPVQAFMPDADDPLVDRGDSLWGMQSAFVGANRDIGAYERGLSPWNVGPGTTDTCHYVWAPRSSVTGSHFVDSIVVDLTTTSQGAEIRYTLDGTEPNRSSLLYTAPVVIKHNAKMRARAFRNGWGSPDAFIRDFTQGVQGYPNMAPRAVCNASSVYPERSPEGEWLYGCGRAIDGDYYSWLGWAPDGGDRRPWLSLDFGRAYPVKYVELFTRAQMDGGERTRRNFAIQGSNNPTFADAVTLASQGATALPFEGVFWATVANTTPFRYVRAIKTVSDEGFFITELRVHCDTGLAPVVGAPTVVRRVPFVVATRETGGDYAITIHWPGKEYAAVTMYDQAGRCVRHIMRTVAAGSSRVSLGKHAAGLYLARWRVGTASGTCVVTP